MAASVGSVERPRRQRTGGRAASAPVRTTRPRPRPTNSTASTTKPSTTRMRESAQATAVSPMPNSVKISVVKVR